MGVVTPPNNSNVGQSWSKWNWYLLKVGQNGTDVVTNWQALLISVENPPPPSTTFPGEIFTTWSKFY